VKYPLLPVAAAFACGIYLERAGGWTGREAAVAIALFLLLACFAEWKAPRLFWACCLAAAASTGLGVAVLHHPRKAPVLDAASDETVALEGCVVSPSTYAGGRVQFTLELARHARARVSVVVRPGEAPPAVSYGQRVEVEARVRTPRNFENPGEFDYRGFLAAQQIYWTAAMHTGSVPRVLPGRCGSRALAWIYGLRGQALDRLEKLYAGNPFAGGLLEAILLGERRRLEPDWQDDFRKAGTYHVLVVAGLHLAAFTAFCFFLLRMLFVSEISALALTCAAAWIFVVLTGGAPPVLRAASGFSLYLVARFFSRRGRILNLLGGIALVFLLIDPSRLFDAGFQLSFLSVMAIGALGAPLLEATSGPFQKGLRGISERARDLRLPPATAQFRVELRLFAETLALRTRIPAGWAERILAAAARLAFGAWELAVISAAIQVGLALPMALYFHRVALAGISANVLVVPLMSVIVPAGFLAVITAWRPFTAAAAWLVEAAGEISLWHARHGPDWRIPDPPLWLSVAFVASLTLLAILLGLTSPRAARFRAGALVLVLLLLGLLLWQPFPPAVEAGKLEVAALDVGQGDSLLVSFPDRRLMVVDAGGIPAFPGMPKPRLDIGEDVVAPYLWSRAIHRIDILVLTHAHADHSGGMNAVIEDFRPRELWTGANSDNPFWDSVRRQAEIYHVKIRSLRAGQNFEMGGARVGVLAPAADYVPGGQPANDDSLVLRVQYKERSFLLTGDAESASEDRMLAGGLVGKADVLKVGHHGSRSSTTEPFLDSVRPAFSVISDGVGNLYHHPNPGVVHRLEDQHSEVLRTDLLGMIRLSTDGHRIALEVFDPAQRRR
jgi:competence protein ComEC